MILPETVLKEFLVTEKATERSSNYNHYTFKVDSGANRISIARAVEETFGVTVTRTNIQNVKPKPKRDRTRRGKVGFKSGYKKAIVTLKEGDTIEII
jgi:large subunit ribosomal protein L23